MATKPSDIDDVRWGTAYPVAPEGETEPTSGKKDSGWLINEKPPAQYFNWLFRKYYQWFDWINDRLVDPNGDANKFGIKDPNTASSLPEITLDAGKVGINNISPRASLHISGENDPINRIQGALSSSLQLIDEGSLPNERIFRIKSDDGLLRFEKETDTGSPSFDGIVSSTIFSLTASNSSSKFFGNLDIVGTISTDAIKAYSSSSTRIAVSGINAGFEITGTISANILFSDGTLNNDFAIAVDAGVFRINRLNTSDATVNLTPFLITASGLTQITVGLTVAGGIIATDGQIKNTGTGVGSIGLDIINDGYFHGPSGVNIRLGKTNAPAIEWQLKGQQNNFLINDGTSDALNIDRTTPTKIISAFQHKISILGIASEESLTLSSGDMVVNGGWGSFLGSIPAITANNQYTRRGRENCIIAWASVDSNGTVSKSYGFIGVVHGVGTGSYVLTLSSTLFSNNYIGIVSQRDSGASPEGLFRCVTGAANQVTVVTATTNNVASDRAFCVVLIGNPIS